MPILTDKVIVKLFGTVDMHKSKKQRKSFVND